MNADEWVGYGLVALGVLAIAVGIVVWVVRCLMHPWVEPTKRDGGWHRW